MTSQTTVPTLRFNAWNLASSMVQYLDAKVRYEKLMDRIAVHFCEHVREYSDQSLAKVESCQTYS